MILKPAFDYSVAIILLIISAPILSILILIASIENQEFGIFRHLRIGKNKQLFFLYKIRTMKGKSNSNITLKSDTRIGRFGRFLRKYKLDEIPQLYNILRGEMSLVGPRPDVCGYANELYGNEAKILSVKPGIFGPAQLKYHNEEEILANQENSQQYNDEVIWPDKVQINLAYVKNWTFLGDLNIILQTLKQVLKKNRL